MFFKAKTAFSFFYVPDFFKCFGDVEKNEFPKKFSGEDFREKREKC